MLKEIGCVEQPDGPSIMIASYPHPDEALVDKELEQEVDRFQRIVYTIRNIRGELAIPPSVLTEVEFLVRDRTPEESLSRYWNDLRQLCNVNEDLRIHHEWEEHAASSSGLVDGIEVRVFWPEEVKEKESARLEKHLSKLEQDVARRRGKLANEKFVSRAPVEGVDRERSALARAEEELELVQRKVESLRPDR